MTSHNLKTTSQCVRAYANANKIRGKINRTIVNKHSDIMVKLYKSLVRPNVKNTSLIQIEDDTIAHNRFFRSATNKKSRGNSLSLVKHRFATIINNISSPNV